MLRTILFILILNIAVPAFSAEIKLRGEKLEYKSISIEGKIEEGDLDKIKIKSYEFILSGIEERKRKPGRLSFNLNYKLNTPGGDIVEAIKIGRFFREVLAEVGVSGKIILDPNTEVGKEVFNQEGSSEMFSFLSSGKEITDELIRRNYSAGVLIFYGAVKRGLNDNGDMRSATRRKAILIPAIGLHRPYYEKEFFSTLTPLEASSAYHDLEVLVRNYLKEMGATQEIIDRMFASNSNKIDLILADEFQKHYKRSESFLEEWLIAKCGSKKNDDAGNNWDVHKCTTDAIHEHQKKWAMEYGGTK